MCAQVYANTIWRLYVCAAVSNFTLHYIVCDSLCFTRQAIVALNNLSVYILHMYVLLISFMLCLHIQSHSLTRSTDFIS